MSLMWAKNAKNKNKLTDPAISTMYTHCTITHITEIRIKNFVMGYLPIRSALVTFQIWETNPWRSFSISQHNDKEYQEKKLITYWDKIY